MSSILLDLFLSPWCVCVFSFYQGIAAAQRPCLLHNNLLPDHHLTSQQSCFVQKMKNVQTFRESHYMPHAGIIH